MRFFKKELPSNPLYLVSGRPVKFRAVRSGVGILATQDAGLLNELDHVVNRKIGGVIEISHPEFLRLQDPDVRPPPLPAHTATFYHSGDYGDIVYSLPTVRELGGGELFLGPDNRSGMPTRQKFDKGIAQNIIPLLDAQSYIHRASFLKNIPEDLAYDLNAMRVLLRKERLDIQQGMNLARCYLRTFRLPIEHDQTKWLTVPAPRHVAPVVINRSARYHNKTFRWDHVVTEYKGKIVFIGTTAEHETFCKDWKVSIPYEPTKDLLDAACVIAGAELFVGNQSCCFAIAEGLKKRVLLERCPWVSNTIFIRGPAPTVNEVSAPAPPVKRSFLEQTEWEAGLFTMPSTLDITVWYNCSIAAYGGKNWLFARRHRYNSGPKRQGESQSDLEIFEVRRNMSVRQAFLPAMPARYPAEQWEDPRAVLGADGSMYVSFATWVHRPKPKWHVRQSLCRLTKDWTRCEVVMEPAYGGNNPVPSKATGPEKNWVFFEHAKMWHFVYSIDPHIVVPVDPGGQPSTPYQNKATGLPWTHGQPRGGSTPVLAGNEFLCFFHSSVEWTSSKRRYFMGAYTFSAVPPFELRRITPEPLLVGSEEDFRVLEGPLVIFPNGALLERDVWTVVFGVNDENCGWIKIPDAELQKRLVKVGG